MPGPTAFVPQSGPVEPTVRKALSVFAAALAMLDKVHLLVIKRFNDKFLSFALAVPSDSSLRGPSLQEILSADRAVWQAVHALIRDHSWSLSDSLNEVAFCRQDIPSALQPRPRAAHVPNPRAAPADPSAAPPPAPGNPRRKRTKSGRAVTPGRPKAKATASSAKANQVPAAKAFDKSWHKKVNGVETCMRGALGRCTDSNCPRSHLCPVPLPNGKPCGQKRTALEHLSTSIDEARCRHPTVPLLCSQSHPEEPASPRMQPSGCRLAPPTSAHPALPTSSAVAGREPVPAQPGAACSIARPAKPHVHSLCITDAFSSGSPLRQPSTARPRSRPSLQMAFEPPHPRPFRPLRSLWTCSPGRLPLSLLRFVLWALLA